MGLKLGAMEELDLEELEWMAGQQFAQEQQDEDLYLDAYLPTPDALGMPHYFCKLSYCMKILCGLLCLSVGCGCILPPLSHESCSHVCLC